MGLLKAKGDAARAKRAKRAERRKAKAAALRKERARAKRREERAKEKARLAELELVDPALAAAERAAKKEAKALAKQKKKEEAAAEAAEAKRVQKLKVCVGFGGVEGCVSGASAHMLRCAVRRLLRNGSNCCVHDPSSQLPRMQLLAVL